MGQHSLPSQFGNLPEEIRLAGGQNALDRGALLSRMIDTLQVDEILADVDRLASSYNAEDYHRTADDVMIDPRALAYLAAPERCIPYPYYFCLPETLISHPDLIFYYRNLAMLSASMMHGIGLDTQSYEQQRDPPDRETAQELARFFNRIVSKLVPEGDAAPYSHLELMMANIGDWL